MTVQTRPLAEVTHDAIRLLTRELGVVETARFLSQFGAGRGDYTVERDALFADGSVDDLAAELRALRDEPRP